MVDIYYGRIIPYIMEKKHVPNHQPVYTHGLPIKNGITRWCPDGKMLNNHIYIYIYIYLVGQWEGLSPYTMEKKMFHNVPNHQPVYIYHFTIQFDPWVPLLSTSPAAAAAASARRRRGLPRVRKLNLGAEQETGEETIYRYT